MSNQPDYDDTMRALREMGPGMIRELPASRDLLLEFALRAPREIPHWFEPEGVRAKPEWPEGLPLLVASRPYTPEQAAAVEALNVWEREWMRARYVQWPWAYARMVLEARPKVEPIVVPAESGLVVRPPCPHGMACACGCGRSTYGMAWSRVGSMDDTERFASAECAKRGTPAERECGYKP